MNNRFTENDIRPSIYKDNMKAFMRADLDRLAGWKEDFATVDCPACNSSNYFYAFNKYNFDFVECAHCGTVFMNPRATPEILYEFYNKSVLYDYWNKHVFPASQETRRNKIFKPRVNRILNICSKYNIPTRCLVEVGAGFGIFCEEMMLTGRFEHIIAIEPCAELAESCQSKGINTIADSVENIDSLETKPNVIASFEVIEHLFSPKDFLLKCYRLMTPDSIIAVTCPNYKGFDISILGHLSESIDAEHINLFNPVSIRMLFEQCGFTVLECFTPGKIDTDIVRNKIIAGELDVSSQPFLKTLLIDRWVELGEKFQKFLQDNNLSSHMWTVAKK